MVLKMSDTKFDTDFDDMDTAFERTGSIPDAMDAPPAPPEDSPALPGPLPADAPVPFLPKVTPGVASSGMEPPAPPMDEPLEAEKAPVAPPAPQKEEEKPAEAPAAEVPAIEAEADSRIEALRAEIERLTKSQMRPAQAEATPVQPAKPLTFVTTDEELTDMVTDAGKFNEVLGKAVATAIQAIAPISRKIVADQLVVNNSVMSFWMRNQDLAPYSAYIGIVTEEVEAAHPDWEPTKIFQEAGKEARTRLEKMGYSLGGTVQPATSVTPSAPAAPKRPAGPPPVRIAGGAPPAPVLSDFEKQFMDMDTAAQQSDV